jgi:transcriptional regulator with XRE-family HTH domain
MVHLGERLRQQRLAKGVALSRIAEETKINTRYLEALESGDWAQLPGSIFARSFARQYAQLVDLDEGEIDAELQTIFPQEENIPPAQTIAAANGILVKPLPEAAIGPVWARLPKPALSLAATLVLCSGVYMSWQRLVLSKGPDGMAIDAARPPNSPKPDLSPVASQPQQGQVAEAATAVLASPGGTMVELNAGTATSPGMKVVLVASEETWISITANGKPVFQGLLQPKDVRLLNGVENARMVIGNAGGIEVQTDGRSIGPIGPSGQVRVVVLTPQGPQIMRTPKPAGSNTAQT